MKKLFLVSVASGYGGAERCIELIARHMPTDIRVWVFAQNAEHITELRRPGVLSPHITLIRIGQTRTLQGRYWAALRLAFEYLRQRPDKMIFNTHTSALLAAMVSRFIPEIGRLSYLYVRDFLWTDLPYIFGRLAGVRVLVPNEVVIERAGYLSPWYLAPTGRASWKALPGMVEIPHDLPSYGSTFLHLATVNPWKGHVDLILAVQKLSARGIQVCVESMGIAGNSGLLEKLQNLVATLKVAKYFHLLPYLPDPSERLRNCRAVLITSVSHSGGPETFGRTVIEAWAHRKPVVAYATGAPARLVRDGIDGLLVPEGDIDGFANAIAQLSRDEALCRRLGEAGYSRAVEVYEAKQVTNQLMDHVFSTMGPSP